MLGRDLTRSRAVLVGTWDYDHLPLVPAARRSLDRMNSVLTGELCGWPVDRVEVVRNRSRPGDLHDQLVQLYGDTDRGGIALFYYVGHGQPDNHDRLCLGLVGSRSEYDRRASTSLRFNDVRDVLLGCRARTKIVILDCCFSGRAAHRRHSLSGSDMLDIAGHPGTYTIAASGTDPAALYEIDGLAPQTYFTKYFADVIQSGIAGEPQMLTLDSIFTETQERLVRDGKPEPTRAVRRDAGRTVFARNAAPLEEQVDYEAEAAQLKKVLADAQRENEELRARLDKDTAPDPPRTASLETGQSVYVQKADSQTIQVDHAEEVALLKKELAEARREGQELAEYDLANDRSVRELSDPVESLAQAPDEVAPNTPSPSWFPAERPARISKPARRSSPWRLRLPRWVLIVAICLAAVVVASDAVSVPVRIPDSDVGAIKPIRDWPTTEPTVSTSKPKPKPKPTVSRTKSEANEPELPGPAPGVIDPDPADPDSKIVAVRLTETLRESHAIPPDARIENDRPLAGEVPPGPKLEFVIERARFSTAAWIDSSYGTGNIRIEANWKGAISDTRDCDPGIYSCSEETLDDGTTFKWLNYQSDPKTKSQAVIVTAPSGAQAYVFQASSLEDGMALPLSAERLSTVGVVVARGLEDR